jgi:hypothetical protein
MTFDSLLAASLRPHWPLRTRASGKESLLHDRVLRAVFISNPGTNAALRHEKVLLWEPLENF